MEYERSLFRVYDRIMEDLSTTQHPDSITDDRQYQFIPLPSLLPCRTNNRDRQLVPTEEINDNNDMDDVEAGLRRRRRLRAAPTRSSRDDSSSQQTENDVMFCSRRILYKSLSVLSILGILQVLVIGCLHVTYVGRGDCIEYALRSRVNHTLAEDEILQIKILDDALCSGIQCSTVRRFTNDSTGGEDSFSSDDFETFDYAFATSEALLFLLPHFTYNHNVTKVNVTLSESCLAGENNATSLMKKFAKFYTGFVVGYDTPVINQLMYGILNHTTSSSNKFRNGFIQNMENGERWSWTEKLLYNHETTAGFGSLFGDPMGWIGRKAAILLSSVFAFYLISSVTALVVRVLTTSGVVMMYPLFTCLRRALGATHASDRLLGVSYPWMGLALDRAASPNRNLSRNNNAVNSIFTPHHMMIAHIFKVSFYYTMYEACQNAWLQVFYGKSIQQGLPVFVYGLFMIWEYHSMLFLRSALSIQFLPKMLMLLFTGYHVYFYSVPYAYFDLAVLPLFLFSLHVMIYSILLLETRVHSSGTVALEHPREVYNALPWPEWTAGFPAEWTLFLPVNSRFVPLYDRQVNNNNAGNDSGGGEQSPSNNFDEDVQDEEEFSDDDISSSSEDDEYPLGVGENGYIVRMI